MDGTINERAAILNEVQLGNFLKVLNSINVFQAHHS
jgi:hypothetical protein